MVLAPVSLWCPWEFTLYLIDVGIPATQNAWHLDGFRMCLINEWMNDSDQLRVSQVHFMGLPFDYMLWGILEESTQSWTIWKLPIAFLLSECVET